MINPSNKDEYLRVYQNLINPSNKDEYLWVYQKDKIKYFSQVRVIMSVKNFRKVLSKEGYVLHTLYLIKRGLAL